MSKDASEITIADTGIIAIIRAQTSTQLADAAAAFIRVVAQGRASH